MSHRWDRSVGSTQKTDRLGLSAQKSGAEKRLPVQRDENIDDSIRIWRIQGSEGKDSFLQRLYADFQ